MNAVNETQEFYKRFFGNHLYHYNKYWLYRLKTPPIRTVVHIPARSSSSRLKNKCIRKLGGLPLMAYSILVARHTPGVDRVIVNTDSEEFAEIAREYGAETPFIRPRELAQGSTPKFVTNYLLGHLIQEGYPLKNLVTLYPTSPFRSVRMLSRMLQRLQTCNVIWACCPTSLQADQLYVPEAGGTRRLFSDNETDLLPPLSLKPLGNFQAVNYTMQRAVRYEMLTNPVELIDIDTAEDLALAEEVICRNMYEFGFPLPPACPAGTARASGDGPEHPLPEVCHV